MVRTEASSFFADHRSVNPDDDVWRRRPRTGAGRWLPRSVLEAGPGWALVARDSRGIDACLVTLALRDTAVATLIGVTHKPKYRPLPLGTCLVHDAIDSAVAHGCRRFSFLTEGGYKQTFWGAEGRPIESGFLARGVTGWAIAATESVLRGSLRLVGRRAWQRRRLRLACFV